jgi:hypothetical protein
MMVTKPKGDFILACKPEPCMRAAAQEALPRAQRPEGLTLTDGSKGQLVNAKAGWLVVVDSTASLPGRCEATALCQRFRRALGHITV